MKKILDPVIVLGGGLIGLGLARVLGRRGIDIYLVVEKKDEAIFSKYCKKTFVDSRTRQDQKVLKNAMKTIGKSPSRRAVVFPTSDLDALTILN